MPIAILLPIVFGVIIGLLLGLIGGGGSILTVPVLVYILGEDVHQATTTSLVIVGVTALSGVVPHARAGRVVYSTALLVGFAGIAGALVGAYLNRQVSGQFILLLFGLLMLVTAARMGLVRRRDEQPAPRGTTRDILLALLAGVVIGALTGFFGVGGGFLIVPALVLVLGFSMPLAVGTSLAIIAINSLAGLAAHAGSIDIDIRLALLFIFGGFVGGILGGELVNRVNETVLSRGFAVFVAVVGLALVIENGLALA